MLVVEHNEHQDRVLGQQKVEIDKPVVVVDKLVAVDKGPAEAEAEPVASLAEVAVEQVPG